MKNRTIIGIVCMLLAIGVAFGVAPVINRTAAQRTDVVHLAADISQGRAITEDDLKIVTVGAYNLSPRAIRDKSQAVGMFAATNLTADAILLETQITSDSGGVENILRQLDGTMQAMSVTIPNLAGGLSGKLRSGDIVSVIATRDNQTSIPAELRYVRVITATTSGGNEAGEVDESGETELPSTVTLLVNDVQATILAVNEANGRVHLSLVYRGNEENAAKFLEAQSAVFTQEREGEDE